ncbi:MAG: HIT family protein [Syntrophomonadaceae bacterium]|jgi:diadenosine tetraphosphate (Ap4A) HIT family hydrolase|nr:HIT family protein [Syntrophomonadaceae bacterium]
MENCIFCEREDLFMENDLAWTKFDKYPVSPGHILIISKRHIADFFSTTPEERRALNQLLDEAKQILDQKYHPDGYNIGINCGEDAGQSIMHLHIHLIPRYRGDLENPKGGVRGVIPGKRGY